MRERERKRERKRERVWDEVGQFCLVKNPQIRVSLKTASELRA